MQKNLSGSSRQVAYRHRESHSRDSREEGYSSSSGQSSGQYGYHGIIEDAVTQIRPPPVSREGSFVKADIIADILSSHDPQENNSGGETYIAFSQDIAGQQGDISPMPPRDRPSKPRFPRTNPAFVGIARPSGQTAYKRINTDQSGYDVPIPDPMTTSFSSTIADYPENYYYLPHDRSDSDTSHSSNRGGFRPDLNEVMHSSPRARDHSDSHSSQGSIRNISDGQSSHSSLRHTQDSVQGSLSSKGSSVGGSVDPEIIHGRTGSQLSQRSFTTTAILEPDYENLNVIPNKMVTSTTAYEHNNLKNLLSGTKQMNNFNEDAYTEDGKSMDSMSPLEYSSQQNTPNSQRSVGTHNSSGNSEGERVNKGGSRMCRVNR